LTFRNYYIKYFYTIKKGAMMKIKNYFLLLAIGSFFCFFITDKQIDLYMLNSIIFIGIYIVLNKYINFKKQLILN